MYNLYSKKATTQGYDSQNVVQVIEAKCTNSESHCNFCGGKIYWNPCVIHRHTKKKLPLSKPYTAHGTTPVAHRACVYNIDNFYTKLVIQDTDNKFVRAKKMEKQDYLRNKWPHRPRSPEEIKNYEEFIKHAYDYTYDSSVKSGVDYSKKMKEVKVRK